MTQTCFTLEIKCDLWAYMLLVLAHESICRAILDGCCQVRFPPGTNIHGHYAPASYSILRTDRACHTQETLHREHARAVVRTTLISCQHLHDHILDGRYVSGCSTETLTRL